MNIKFQKSLLISILTVLLTFLRTRALLRNALVLKKVKAALRAAFTYGLGTTETINRLSGCNNSLAARLTCSKVTD